MLYLIKVNIILALLCLLFQVVMHRDTFFGVRRAMLWGIYLTAFLLPLCDVQLWMQNDAATMHLASDYATYVLPTLDVSAVRVAAMGIQPKEPGCGMWFVGMLALWGIIYLIPVVWMTLKLLWQFTYIIYLRCTCRWEGSYFRYPRPCSPFSFGSWIFLHPDGMDEQTLRSGEGLPFLAYTDGAFCKGTLFLTTLPVMEITVTAPDESGSYEVLDREKREARMVLFDNRAALSDGDRFCRSSLTIRIRGNTSAVLPKLSYRLSLFRDSGGKQRSNHMDLLGLRSDEDWILYCRDCEKALGLDKLIEKD